MGAFLLIVIIVGIIGYFTCSKEARVMRDVDRDIKRNAEEFKKRYGMDKQPRKPTPLGVGQWLNNILFNKLNYIFNFTMKIFTYAI